MTDGRSRRRVLTGVGTTVAVGLAGCSSDGGGTTEDGDSGDDETPTGTAGRETEATSGEQTESTPGEQTESTPAGDEKPLTFRLRGTSDYQSEVITVESLTFVAASADDDSLTFQLGETVDLSDGGDSRGQVLVAENLAVPYGTYESVEMTVTPVEVVDSEGSSVDVSAGTVSLSWTERDGEPRTVDEGYSPDATLALILTIRDGRYAASGYYLVGV